MTIEPNDPLALYVVAVANGEPCGLFVELDTVARIGKRLRVVPSDDSFLGVDTETDAQGNYLTDDVPFDELRYYDDIPAHLKVLLPPEATSMGRPRTVNGWTAWP